MKSFGKKPEDRQAENQLAQAALSQPPAATDKLKAALQFAADKNPLKSLILADFYLFDIRRYYKDGFEGLDHAQPGKQDIEKSQGHVGQLHDPQVVIPALFHPRTS